MHAVLIVVNDQGVVLVQMVQSVKEEHVDELTESFRELCKTSEHSMKSILLDNDE